MTNAGKARAIRTRQSKQAPRRDEEAAPLGAPMASDTFEPLTTERLTLRPLTDDDAEALHRLVNDWEVTRTLAVVPFPYPRELADEWIGSTRQSLSPMAAAYHLAITGREGERGNAGRRRRRCASMPADPRRPPRLLGRPALLGPWRRHRGGRAPGALGARQSRPRPARGRRDHRQSRLGRGAAPHRLPPDRRRHANNSSRAAASMPVLALRGNARRHIRRPSAGGGAPRHADGSKPLLLVAACALIDTDGRVLLARRPEGKKMAGLWEFPGGKLHPGETPEAALIRELKEELGIDVPAACLAPFAFASHAYERFHLLMPLYLCRRWKGMPTPRENQTLAWVRPQKLADYPMPPADKPLIPLLRDFL